MKRLTLLALSGLAALLSGCGTLNETVQQRIAIAEQCRQVLDGTYRSQWEIPDKLLERRLGSLRSCSPLESSPDTREGKFVSLCAFDEIDRAHRLFRPEDGKLPDQIARLKNAKQDMERALEILRNSVSLADGAIRESINSCMTGSKMALCLVTTKDWPLEIATTRHDIFENLAKVRMQSAELQSAIRAIAAVLSQAAKNDIAAWEANFEAQLAKFEQAAAGDVRLLIRDSALNHALRYSARRSLDLLHKALRPVDAALNRADDKAYGVISAGNFFFGNSIQTAVNESFEAIQESYRRRLADDVSQPSINSFLTEMGRAACEDIEKKTEVSMLGELVDTMFISNINGAIEKIPQASTDEAKPDGKAADKSNSKAAPMAKKPVALDALIAASAPPASKDTNTRALTPAKTFPADVYMVHEWAARQLLLKRQIREHNRASGGTKSNELPIAEAVDEASVERLAESAAAEVIDDALRASPSGQIPGTGTTPSSISLSVATQSVVQVSAVLAPAVFVSSVNTVSPSFAPVINFPEPKSTRDSTLCSDANFPANATCLTDGKSSVITLRTYYPTGECDDKRIAALVVAVGNQIHRFADVHRLRFDARVDGYASKRHVQGAKCPQAATAKLVGTKGKLATLDSVCSYRNLLHQSVLVDRCEENSKKARDGNVLLSAARAQHVAKYLEDAGNGSILVREVVANGSAGAFVVAGNDNVESDRTVMIRLRPVGLQ